MSKNLETVASMYEAFKRGQLQFILDNLAEDVEWVFHGDPATIPWAGSYQGKVGVQLFFERLAGSSSDHVLTNVDWVDGGDKVVALGNFSAIASTTGRPFYFNWAHAWAFNAEGQATRFVDYTDTQVQAVAFSTPGLSAGA